MRSLRRAKRADFLSLAIFGHVQVYMLFGCIRYRGSGVSVRGAGKPSEKSRRERELKSVVLSSEKVVGVTGVADGHPLSLVFFKSVPLLS